MTVLALVGAQYGSEGKGVIASGMASNFMAAVRTGGPNAGHSFYYQDQLFKMRQVPCAWVEPGMDLILGAGAVVDPALLEKELTNLTFPCRVTIDRHAVLVQSRNHETEANNGMREKIGSTLEGVGEARIDKIRRDGTAVLAERYVWDDELVRLDDTAERLWDHLRRGHAVMLEGTQGAGLSLHHGKYPFVTSNDTNAAQLAADAGIPPSEVQHTHLVARAYPIRVAGNSGPLEEETTFAALGVPEEHTTVTNKVRRIGHWDDDLFDRALMLNNPCGLWLTFGDYIDPEIVGETSIDKVMESKFGDWYRNVVAPYGVRLMGVGTGGDRWAVAPTGDYCDTSRPHPPKVWKFKQEVRLAR